MLQQQIPLFAIQHYRVCRSVESIKSPLRQEVSRNLHASCGPGVFVTIKRREGLGKKMGFKCLCELQVSAATLLLLLSPLARPWLAPRLSPGPRSSRLPTRLVQAASPSL